MYGFLREKKYDRFFWRKFRIFEKNQQKL